MAKYCPATNNMVVYLECLDCETRECRNSERKNEERKEKTSENK